jgi:uncharacterized protein
MPLIINLVDIPSEGQSIDCEVMPSEIVLPCDDGKILESLHCAGKVFLPNDRMAHFQGTLTGRVARECVRCLTIFEEDLFLNCDADFCQSTASVLSPDFSKKMKKGSRTHIPLRENLILAAPPHPLCQESCSGLCQVCGANLNEGVCGCYSPVAASSSVVSDTPSMASKKTSKPSPRPV